MWVFSKTLVTMLDGGQVHQEELGYCELYKQQFKCAISLELVYCVPMAQVSYNFVLSQMIDSPDVASSFVQNLVLLKTADAFNEFS